VDRELLGANYFLANSTLGALFWTFPESTDL
jgi:hypothetical protein